MSVQDKKYKLLKTNVLLFNYDTIFKENDFVGLFQAKYLNFNDLIELRKLLFKLNLKAFFCKNTFINKKFKIFNVLDHNFNDSFAQGNLIIIYSKSVLKIHIFDSLLKSNIIPLVYCMYKKLILPNNIKNFLSMFQSNSLIQLVCLLEGSNKCVYSSVSLFNKLFVNVLSI